MPTDASPSFEPSHRRAMAGFRFNARVSAIVLAACAVVLFLAPALRVPTAWATGAAALLVLGTPTHWALIHEAIHGRLLRDPRRGRWLGRVLAVAFGSPLRSLEIGHLVHHRTSRTTAEPGEVVPGRTITWRHHATYYLRLVGGLHAAELLAVPLAFLPAWALRGLSRGLQRRDASAALTLQRLSESPALREQRIDAMGVVALYATSIAWFGCTPALAILILGRAGFVSVFDNAFHYGTPLGDSRHATDAGAPRPLARWMLNFHLHGAHHRAPGTPWFLLEADVQATTPSVARCLARQFRGPLLASQLPRHP